MSECETCAGQEHARQLAEVMRAILDDYQQGLATMLHRQMLSEAEYIQAAKRGYQARALASLVLYDVAEKPAPSGADYRRAAGVLSLDEPSETATREMRGGDKEGA